MNQTLTLRVVGFLLVLVSVTYLNSLSGSFHFDDFHSIQNNISIQSLKNIPSLWTDATTSSFIPENRNYRPLTFTVHAICWFLGKGATWPFHGVKIALHFLTCLAVYLIWKTLWSLPGWFPLQKTHLQLGKNKFIITPEIAAFILSCLFAVHPACSECVDYISATSSLLCSVLYVWAYYFYLNHRFKNQSDNHSGVGVSWDLVLSLIFYGGSVAAKEEGITLPAVLFMSEWFFQGFKLRGVLLRRIIPFVLAFIIFGLWLYWKHPVEGNESRGGMSVYSYFLTQWRAYLWYMRLWFWPWGLNADYATVIFSKSILDPLVIQAAFGNFFVLALSWILRKKIPSLLFGFCWFYITVSPASSIVVLAEAMNEHRMYLAYLGFVGGTFIFLFYLIESFSSSIVHSTGPNSSKWVMGSVATVIVILMLGTQQRNQVWANDESLWKDTVEKNPDSGRALNNLALVYLGRGEYSLAIQYLTQCEKLWPSYMYCPLNKGISHLSLGRVQELSGRVSEAQTQFDLAEKSLLRAFRLNPRSVHTQFNLGRYYSEIKKDYFNAKQYFLGSLEASGGRFPLAESYLAYCFLKLDHIQEAEDRMTHAYSQVDSQDSIDEQILLIKGRFEVERQKIQKAMDTLRRVVDLYPQSEEGWMKLRELAETRGNYPLALRASQRLLMLSPLNGLYQAQFKRLEELVFRVGLVKGEFVGKEN